MSSNNSDDSDEKRKTDSFSDLMKGVKPLTQDKIDPDSTPKPKAVTKSADHLLNQENLKPQSLGELEYVTPVAPDETLSFVRGGIQDKLKIKLKKGLIPFELKLDLHGATVKVAAKELQYTIEHAYSAGMRCILVIHGRGLGSFDNKPALKTHVNYWLRELPQVLAFHSAQPKHGGVGALYVLLKRQKEK